MNKEFETHILNEQGIQNSKDIAVMFNGLLENLKLICNAETREFSITKTKLEEACFFAKKSMAIVKENQRGE